MVLLRLLGGHFSQTFLPGDGVSSDPQDRGRTTVFKLELAVP